MIDDALAPVLDRMLRLWNGDPLDPAEIYAARCDLNGVTTFQPADIVEDVARLRAALPDLVFTVHERTTAGPWWLLRMSAEGTHRGDLRTALGAAPASGRRLRMHGLEAFQVENDRITAVWLAWDWSETYAALGATLGGVLPAA